MHNAFIPKAHQPKLNNFCDKYYYDVKLVDKVKKVGEGEDAYIIVKKEVISKTDIKEVIASQADDVGLNNILKQFALTGDPSVLPQGVHDNGLVVDYTQMPQDLIEAENYFKKMQAQFEALPEDLKKGRSFSEFMANFNQAEFDAYFNALKAQNARKAQETPADKEKEGDK